ncbi:MAG: FAD-binding oxidoreductase [Nostocaceae cyanobacterium]|nr:FAD-binding oxidoreductase [Nostocaceae cyanobacterium]
MKAIASQLASIVGAENPVWDWENVAQKKQQRILPAIAPGRVPKCIVYPQTTEELAAVISCCHSNRWRILPCGSGSKLYWGGLGSDVDVVVSTERLQRLIDHAVGDLTVTVEAGMKFSDLQAVLAKSKQFLALDPTSPETATIGGIVATGDTGSLRQRYSSVRDQLLGISFVRSDGKIVKAGGRVVKNVAGYDLMKLLTGSYGTLGVFSQLTFRVYPLPDDSQTVVLIGAAEDIEKAANTLRSSALTPTQADLLSAPLVSSLGLGKDWGLIARFQSISESVQEQSNRLLEVGQKLGLIGTIYTGADETNLWQPLKEQMHSITPESAITCKIGVLPTAAVAALKQAAMGCIHISSGLGVLRFNGDIDRVLKMRNYLGATGGFLSVLAAPVGVKQKIDVWGYGGNSLQMMRLIKQQFDPEGIFISGRFVGGI